MMDERRGQIEMVGLVFVVVLLILGILLYVRLSAAGDERAGDLTDTAERVQQSNSFLVALKETTLCGTTFERAVRACIEDERLCPSGDPCIEVQDTMDRIVAATLIPQGYLFNLSIVGTDVMNVTGCISADPEVLLASGAESTIVLSGARPSGRLKLSICR